MKRVETKSKVKYKDIDEVCSKNLKIQLTMDGDTPGYYSIDENNHQLRRRRAYRRKNK